MLIALYLAAIVLANLSVAYFGPASTIVNAFLFIGLDISTRDMLHERWHGKRLWTNMALLIAGGSLLSYLLNRDAGPIATASLVAFFASGAADALVYAALGKSSKFTKINGSNVVSAAVDSIVFPTIAFGAFMPWVALGQFLAKTAGGAFWAWLLTRKRLA